MLDPSTQSQSQSQKPLSKSNGADTDPPTGSNERKFMLEDFSQDAINRGQVEINYLLTGVNGHVGDALREVRNAFWQMAQRRPVDFDALDKAIDEVYEANKKVAGPFPPGCDLDLVREK